MKKTFIINIPEFHFKNARKVTMETTVIIPAPSALDPTLVTQTLATVHPGVRPAIRDLHVMKVRTVGATPHLVCCCFNVY